MARGSRGTVRNDEGGVAAGRQSKEMRDQISVHAKEAERVNPKVERERLYTLKALLNGIAGS